jgi:hypothetical protein
VDGRDALPSVDTGVAERVPDDPLGPGDADRLDRDSGVLLDLSFRFAKDQLPEVQRAGRADVEFDARVEILRVLPDDHEIDVLEAGANSRIGLAGALAGVEVELLAERDVHAPESGAHGGRDRTLEADLIPAE